MDKKIVLVGAGSTSFGPSSLSDLFLSEKLTGSTIVLHDIDKNKLDMMYELCLKENEMRNNKFIFEQTTKRKNAFKGADFIISSIEVGDRFPLWRQDQEIPRKYGSTQILGECGGPGGTFHAFRIIPPIVEIVQDAEKICPKAFFINFSNPMSRVCLAIKRATQNLKFVGLCHQIGFFNLHFPKMLNMSFKDLKMTVVGLNHFGFLLGLENWKTGVDLMPRFHSKAMDYFVEHEDRFMFSTLTFEVYKKFGYFPHSGDNHLGEYIQFGEEFTKEQDMLDWIDRAEDFGKAIYYRFNKGYKRLKKGRYSKKGTLLKVPSGERAVPIIEEILTNKKKYESSVNIPNDGLVDNLPQDLVIEGPAIVDKEGVHGVKIGNIPKNIAALLRIEATIQDLCVEAVLKKSKELAIAAIAVDPNVGSFEKADKMFNEMYSLQKEFLPHFK
ncbi:MAG: family 4 glycosyl hydrolase [Promethearchaeota archaeon]